MGGGGGGGGGGGWGRGGGGGGGGGEGGGGELATDGDALGGGRSPPRICVSWRRSPGPFTSFRTVSGAPAARIATGPAAAAVGADVGRGSA